MLFMILIGLAIIAFAAYVYMLDGTDFAKLTKYSSFDLMFNSEARKLHTIYKTLQLADGEREILLNVHVQEDDTVYKIPAILVHESGVYVFTDVNVEGWVVGSERSFEWANVQYKNKTSHFDNPILVNRRYVYALRDQMQELPDTAFHSVVLFNDGCSFHKVDVTSRSVDVLKLNELKSWTNDLEGSALTADDIQTIYMALKDRMDFQKKVVAPTNKKRKKQIA